MVIVTRSVEYVVWVCPREDQDLPVSERRWELVQSFADLGTPMDRRVEQSIYMAMQERAEKAEAALAASIEGRTILAKDIVSLSRREPVITMNADIVGDMLRAAETRAQQAESAAAQSHAAAVEAQRKVEELTARLTEHQVTAQTRLDKAYDEMTTLKGELAARPVAVPDEWIAFRTAFTTWLHCEGPKDAETVFEGREYADLCFAMAATENYCGTRCVSGWAYPVDLQYANTVMCQVFPYKQQDTSMVPVTLCWTEARREASDA